jgi:rubrerythrin
VSVNGVGQKEVFMLSNIPVDLKVVYEKDIDKEVLRAAIIAELDAINLYVE